jgi:hypothetical protein
VELHRGEFSHDPPVGIIEVLGADATTAIRQELARLGYTAISTAAQGFVARRAAVTRR